ncbi:MAG TPA: competence/damage-inducible protein A [Tenuifilaceae bacterium]|nr:competence/damage-inducible protein A [Tenuifilaceae bacterium]
MNAAILTIGQEILIGQIVDTNSAWISQQLNGLGIDVKQILSIPDESEVIYSSINQLLNTHDIVITTGGLGPTSDDITKPVLCKLFNCGLVSHGPTLNHIKEIFTKRGLPVTELNIHQADVPESCDVLMNSAGTAPGMWFKRNNSVLISLPGVPFEMKRIFKEHIMQRLAGLDGRKVILHRTILTFGLPESFLAEKISDWERDLPQNISLAYLPNHGIIRLRLSCTGKNNEEVESLVKHQIEKLSLIIPDNIYGFDDDTLEQVVGKLLKETQSTLSVAESCTGGTVAQLITSIPGASQYFRGGVIAYSNMLKMNLLSVDKDAIEKHGVVSKEVVEEMAINSCRIMDSDYAIAISGIAGPDGGTSEKPVGTVWIAVAKHEKCVAKRFNFSDSREVNIARSAYNALNMLRLFIQQKNL